jgi:hypothetical protein
MQQDKTIRTFVLVAALTASAYALAYTIDAIIAKKLLVPLESPTQTVRDHDDQSARSVAGESNGTAASGGVNTKGTAQGTPHRGGRRAAVFEKVSDDRWLVDRKALLATTADLNRLLKQARTVPFMKQGKQAGVKLTRISPGSMYEKMGLRKGDVIMRVNARNLDDPSGFFRLYQELRLRRTIFIDLDRNGQQLTFTYEVR